MTFANELEQRYPFEAGEYRAIAEGLPFKLGGLRNNGFNQNIGLLDADAQRETYRRCRAYLYSTGLIIPYTLNFIEAWMTGIPVMVLAPYSRIGRYFEIERLIVNGENGFICRSTDEVRSCAQTLLNDQDLAGRVGQKGRESAIAYFGNEGIKDQWQRLFIQMGFNQ